MLLLLAVIDGTSQILKLYNISLVSAESHFVKFFKDIIGAQYMVLQLTKFCISSLQDG